MRKDREPIIKTLGQDIESATIYFAHDIHKGAANHDEKKWEAYKKQILADDTAYVCFIGDMMENATPNSKSDMFYQVEAPHEQKMWVRDQLLEMRGKVLSITDGNHERNRSTKTCGMFPLYDAAVMAGLEDAYRPHLSIVDIGIGRGNRGKPLRYVGVCVHAATSQVKFCSADAWEGIDFFAYGHDHSPKDIPRGKMIYDPHNKGVYQRSIEVINSGAFLTYDGYAIDGKYRPTSDKVYKYVIDGRDRRKAHTVGFYV